MGMPVPFGEEGTVNDTKMERSSTKKEIVFALSNPDCTVGAQCATLELLQPASSGGLKCSQHPLSLRVVKQTKRQTHKGWFNRR